MPARKLAAGDVNDSREARFKIKNQSLKKNNLPICHPGAASSHLLAASTTYLSLHPSLSPPHLWGHSDLKTLLYNIIVIHPAGAWLLTTRFYNIY